MYRVFFSENVYISKRLYITETYKFPLPILLSQDTVRGALESNEYSSI